MTVQNVFKNLHSQFQIICPPTLPLNDICTHSQFIICRYFLQNLVVMFPLSICMYSYSQIWEATKKLVNL